MGNESSNVETFRETLSASIRSAGFWSVIAAVAGVIAAAAGTVLVLFIEEIRNFSIIVLITGLTLLFIALVLSPRAVAMFMAGRRGRYGTNVAIMTVAFFAIVVLLNFLFFRTSTRFDTTATRIFTLSPKTVQVLERLPSLVRANAFFVPGDAASATALQRAEDLLNEFSRQGPNFSYRFVDPQLERDQALKYSVREFPTVVFEDIDQGSQQAIPSFTEQDFLTGILIATGIERKKVYYLTGHGEASRTRDPPGTGDADPDGFDFALEGMQADNYDVRPLNLQQGEEVKVPEDAAVLVIAGPKNDLSDAEKDAIVDYLLDGGKLAALLDPDTPDSYRELLSLWGVLLTTDHVADVVSNVAGEELTPMAQKSNGQFLTGGESFGISIADPLDVVFFPDSAGMRLGVPADELPPYILYTPLVVSTPASWLETDPDEVKFDFGVDPRGPVDLVVVVQAGGTLDGRLITQPNKLLKMVIFGDSDFARNNYFFSSENSDLVLNSVNWLADDFDLISVGPKLFPFRELVVNRRERDFIKWSSWLVPPTIMLILGIFVWWRRR